jgi:PemK-like, MazF-like toxin of type II toxin-antitoxin system
MSFVRRLKNVFAVTAPTPEQPGILYAPERDGEADPGEVVWAWVPYEEDPSQGKDRPVILLARGTGEQEGQWLGLGLTSKDHDRDAEQEAGWGRYWMDVGAGGWDSEGRPSEVRLDRLLVLDAADIRREGAALDEGIFERVVEAARAHHALP